MQTYVFSLGLIPVQEFIAEARRSRDLRTGSAILSWITANILSDIRENMNGNVVIPHHASVEFVLKAGTLEVAIAKAKYSIPNRASGYCTAESDEKLKERFAELEKKWIENFWRKQIEKVENEIQNYFENISMHGESPFQLIWVALPVDGDYNARKQNENVKDDIEKIGKFFDDVKNTRPIKPWLHGAPIGKCTQCGKREAISPEGFDFQQWWKWYQNIVNSKEDIQSGYKFEKSERLCEVCIVKRILGYNDQAKNFPSTNKIAINHWFSILADNWNNEIKTEFNCFKELMDAIKEDQILVFYRRNHPGLIKRIKQKIPEIDKDSLKSKLKRICDHAANFIKNKNLSIDSTPPNSLSIITYDGDDMGKKIVEHLGKVVNNNGITQELFEFQKGVNDLIQDHHAQAYYTGGDEGLILCPIETTLKLVLEINALFSRHFKDIDPEMTLSMGIVFFDRERPMGTAIKQAQELLQIAKHIDEKKNALAVGVQTASGNQWHFMAHWGVDWERIENILTCISNGILSKGWAYEVEEFVRNLPPDVMGSPTLRNAAVAEIKRITWRKFDRKGEPEWDNMKKETAFDEFWNNKYFYGDQLMENIKDYSDIQTWANQFHLIGFLSRYKIV